MHSLKVTFSTFAAALCLVTGLSAASSQAKSSPDKPAGIIEHKVAKGETLWSISQKHQTSIGEIMSHNKLDSNQVREGMILKIPPREAVTPSTNNIAVTRPVSGRESIHIVKNGETFWSIAEKHKVNPQTLAEANPNLNPNRLHPDMEVIVPSSKLASPAQKTTPAAITKSQPQPSRPAQNSPASANTFQHTLVQGETFYSLGKKYSVKLADVISANPNLKPERLAPGTKVNIPGKGPANVAANTKAPAPAPANVAKTTTAARPTSAPAPASASTKHTVKTGDSIANIAQRYEISPEALLRENNLKAGDPIYIDDVLTIPVSKKSAVSDTSNSKSVEKPSATSPQQQTASTKTSPAPAPEKKEETVATENKAKEPGPVDVAPDGSIVSYTISFGETEETICEAFGITKKELFEYNKLGQGAKLRPGDEIMIPPTTKTIVAR